MRHFVNLIPTAITVKTSYRDPCNVQFVVELSHHRLEVIAVKAFLTTVLDVVLDLVLYIFINYVSVFTI